MKTFSSKKSLLIRIFLYSGIALITLIYILLCNVGLGLPCVIYETSGILCPSCGATRSLMSFITLDFKSAAQYHPIFGLVLYPSLLLLVVQDFYISLMNFVKHKHDKSMLTFVFGKQS